MDKINFQVIVNSLREGREIEFFYKGKQYSITNSSGYWNFCCDTDNVLIEKICPFKDKETLTKRVGMFSIDGIPMPMIFNETKYDILSICIL